MIEQHSFLSATLAELSRRKVLRALGGYAVGVFALLQLMDAAAEPLRIPGWVQTLVVILVILGFPVVFLLSWHLDLTTRGIRRADAAGLLTKRQSGLLFGGVLLLTAGLGYVLAVNYSAVFEEEVAAPAVARSFTAPENSIAVLPFADLSEQGDQAYFSEGMTEEILNLLAQVDGLHVAARTSSFAFRDRNQDVREIGRLLNVRTVLEGSVRTSGDRIRLTAQLINVEDGYHIWSQSYDRTLDDVFAIQDEVASNIAKALVASFAGLEHTATGKTDSLAAANAYRTGRLHWWRRTPAELQRAIGLFAEALQHDPGFAPAYAAMADTYLLLSQYGNIAPARAIEKAEPMIEKALALDPQSAEGFAALGLARYQIGQADAAESALRRAIEINEDYIPAHVWLANALNDQGRYPEQQRVLEQALTLDPLNELLAVNLAHTRGMRGDAAAGEALLRNLVAVRPDSTLLLRSLGELEFYSGSLFEGWQQVQQAHLLEPEDPVEIASLAKLWLTLGRTDEADQLLKVGLEKSDQNYILLNVQWLTLLVTGRLEEAERLARDFLAAQGEEIPESLRRIANLRLGMLALIQGQNAPARSYLEAAIPAESESPPDSDTLLALTLGAVAAERNGDAAAAASLLDAAERRLQRARVNGVDDAEIYYNEAAVLAMRGTAQPALEKLQQAYDRGFRELWMVDIDGRLDALRGLTGFADFRARIVEDIGQCLAAIRNARVASL